MAIVDWGVNITGPAAGQPAGTYGSLKTAAPVVTSNAVPPPAAVPNVPVSYVSAAGAAPASNPHTPGSAEYNAWENARIAALTGPGPAGGSATAAGAAAAQQLKDLAAKQAADQQAILDRMKGFVSSQETLPDLYNRLSTEAGVPALQAQQAGYADQTLTVEDLIRKLPADVASITAGEGEARRNLVEGAKMKTLTEQAADLSTMQARIGNQLASAVSGVGTQTQLYGDQFNRELDTYKTELAAFSDQAAREATMYTTAVQDQLDGILKDIQNAEDFRQKLTLQQQDFAFQAAQAEAEWIKTKEQIQLNFTNDLKKMAYGNSLSGSSTDKTTISTVKNDINNAVGSIGKNAVGSLTASPGDVASSYVWNLQNKQPDLFNSADWNQLWSYVSSLKATKP